MKKILLICNAGMSTSMLVAKMRKYAKLHHIDVQVDAEPFVGGERRFYAYDLILLGPQVRHQLEKMQKIVKGTVPIGVVNMRDYGMMNGEAVVKQAMTLLEGTSDNFP